MDGWAVPEGVDVIIYWGWTEWTGIVLAEVHAVEFVCGNVSSVGDFLLY